MTRTTICGVGVSAGKREELLGAVRALLGVGGRVYTLNPLMVMGAVHEEAVRDVLNRATLNIPDGIGIRRALMRAGVPTDTLPGVELGEELPTATCRIALLGAAPGVAAAAFSYLQARTPGLSCCFVKDGYSYTEADVTAAVRNTCPDLMYVCLGTPKQEILIDRLSAVCPATLYIGLGGSFDIYAGKRRRAPSLFRRYGAEWLFRMAREPRRLSAVPTLIRFRQLVNREFSEKNSQNRAGKDGGFS